MVIVYIHGASATPESFTYIREQLNGQEEIMLDYDSSNGFANNLAAMKEQLKDTQEIFFIAHSLGGIYALHLADYYPEKVLGAVTLSTPYGGSREADYARYFLPFSRLMRDVGPNSEPMSKVKKLKFPAKNWTNVVTTKGDSPWITEPNDGVVTYRSMRYLDTMNFVDIDLNHYEVVISRRVVKIIKDRIEEMNSK